MAPDSSCTRRAVRSRIAGSKTTKFVSIRALAGAGTCSERELPVRGCLCRRVMGFWFFWQLPADGRALRLPGLRAEAVGVRWGGCTSLVLAPGLL